MPCACVEGHFPSQREGSGQITSGCWDYGQIYLQWEIEDVVVVVTLGPLDKIHHHKELHAEVNAILTSLYFLKAL